VKVYMLMSVSDPDYNPKKDKDGSGGGYVAGEYYDVEPELGDLFILRGYATGILSRKYTPDEASVVRRGVQHIGVGDG
jgi:hypothetical protein